MGSEGLHSFCEFFREHFQRENMSLLKTRNLKLVLPTSCHVSGVICPNLTNALDDDSVLVACSSGRFLQRFVATNNFYDCSKRRLNSSDH